MEIIDLLTLHYTFYETWNLEIKINLSQLFSSNALRGTDTADMARGQLSPAAAMASSAPPSTTRSAARPQSRHLGPSPFPGAPLSLGPAALTPPARFPKTSAPVSQGKTANKSQDRSVISLSLFQPYINYLSFLLKNTSYLIWSSQFYLTEL